jgi:16S rRNA G966 N2-methylase RsmD
MAPMSLRYPVAKGLRAVAWRIERPRRRRRRQAARLPGLGAFMTAGSASGSRTASWFFEQFPRFYMTSSTAATTGRLNLRYEAIIGENRDIFDGASVLDLGSHDGRWSFAALAAGARSVIGIEARPELVQTAMETLAGYGYGPDRVRFVARDVHQALATQEFEADVVLCLGFLYHTLRYNELLDGIRRTNARYLIIDTFSPFMKGPVPNVNVITEDADDEGKAAADIYTHEASVLVGRPNLEAIKTMLDAYGYRVERLSDWAGLLSDNPGAENCGDYANGKRITVRCVKVMAAPATIDGHRQGDRVAYSRRSSSLTER